jgi:hypothetical protein
MELFMLADSLSWCVLSHVAPEEILCQKARIGLCSAELKQF